MPPLDPHLGNTYGDVKLTKCIGHGAMGAVYQGWHARLGREVAVKVLLNRHAKGNIKERFLREGQAAAKVHHENVVEVMQAGEQDGVTYLVMELVNGRSLGALVDEKGPLPCEAVARIGAQVARGLLAIHAQGIIHRDIKPDNILIGDDRKAKITDLGLAKQTDDPELSRLTATGIVVGTPLYVSPEAIRDPQSSTISTDIYSLGATLYHLLVGHPPFEGDSPYEVMRGHLELAPRPLRELRPDIPSPLAQLVGLCMHKSPGSRPTAWQVAELLSGGANLKANAGRGLATLVGIAAVVVLGGAALGWFALQRLRHAPPAVPATAKLTITTVEPGAQVRIAGGRWQQVSGDPLPLGPGNHRIEVRANRPGPLLRHVSEQTVVDQQHLILPVTLAPVAVPQASIPVPGEGMLYVDGMAIGTAPAWMVTQAGNYALGRWSGRRWQSCTATVDERGQVAIGAPVEHERPAGGAWWRTTSEAGRRTPHHHVVNRWEVDHVRPDAKALPSAPPDQEPRGEQSATGLTPELGAATATALGGRVPDPTAALRLSGEYRRPVWSSDEGRLAAVGGPAADALLILVPADPARP